MPLGAPLMDTRVEVRDEQGRVVTEGEGQVFIGETDLINTQYMQIVFQRTKSTHKFLWSLVQVERRGCVSWMMRRLLSPGQ